MLSANLRLVLTSDSLRQTLIKAAKSLLLSRLSNDWQDAFERVITQAQAHWEIKKLGY